MFGVVHEIENVHNRAADVLPPREHHHSVVERNGRIIDRVAKTRILPFDNSNRQLLCIMKIDAHGECGEFDLHGLVGTEFR